jgi:SAM-dependent methyltransferase
VSGFNDHFSAVAASYARFRPSYPAELFAWLASIAPAREVALDCATGNGQAAVALAEHFDRVVAIDASAGQVANAIRHPRVEYRAVAVESSGLPSRSADLVTVAQALHWFDIPRFFEEVDRILRPAGVVATWTYGHLRFGIDPLDQVYQELHEGVLGPYWPPERRMVDDGYRALAFPFHELVAPEFRIDRDLSQEELTGYVRTWSATQAFVRTRGFDPIDGFEDRLRGVWPASEHRLPVSFPLMIRVGRVGA